MKIKNVKVAFLKESIIRSGYPMQTGEPEELAEHYIQRQMFPSANSKTRAYKLANTPNGSGHNNFLKGVIVQFDLQYPQYFTPQLQRYHWVDIISSQSKMHSLTKIKDIGDSCNKYVTKGQCSLVKWLVKEIYNKEVQYPVKFYDEYKSFGDEPPYIINSKEECFQYIISNLPMGFELWMGISTNYLQLKTIYTQRKNHKLSEWGEFCDWIKTLPMSELITGENKHD